MMDQKQLEHLVLQVQWQDHRAYRGKTLCQACFMEKGAITTPEDQMMFEHVWHQWVYGLKQDRCVVCGQLKETIMLQAK